MAAPSHARPFNSAPPLRRPRGPAGGRREADDAFDVGTDGPRGPGRYHRVIQSDYFSDRATNSAEAPHFEWSGSASWQGLGAWPAAMTLLQPCREEAHPRRPAFRLCRRSLPIRYRFRVHSMDHTAPRRRCWPLRSGDPAPIRSHAESARSGCGRRVMRHPPERPVLERMSPITSAPSLRPIGFDKKRRWAAG